MSVRDLERRVLSPFSLSNQTILWASIVGAIGTLVFVPDRDGNPIAFAVLAVVALASQAGFALAVVACRAVRSEPGPAYVAGTLLLAGAVRGVLISLGAGLADGRVPNAGSLAERAINSAIICLVGGGLIGATLEWRADFRSQYRMLLDRALVLERAQRTSEPIDPDVLRAWTSMKIELDGALRRAARTLAAGTTERELTEAADLITSAVDTRLRPASRAMWQDATPNRPPITMRDLFAATVGSWQLPLGPILGFFAVVVGLGAVVRIGLVPGLAFTLGYLVITGAVLALSNALVRRRTGSANVIAIATIVLLPIVLFSASLSIAHGWFSLPGDVLADAVLAVQTPISVILVAMAVEAVRARQEILDALQSRIDGDVQQLLQSEGGVHGDAQRLSLFVHHSVQSELSALAMQLREAALTHDAETREAVAGLVLARLGTIEDLDPQAPPWLKQASGLERMDEVIRAWSGILVITTRLPEVECCRQDQWHVAAQVIEEALANAARHGDATSVDIAGTAEHGTVTLRITDDGSTAVSAVTSSGIGLQWLEQIAPGDWSLAHSDSGSVLTVAIR